MEHIAIDLGGRESAVCIRSKDGTILEERRVKTKALDFYLKKRPKSRVVMETCAEAFGVADVAKAQGHEVRVVPATLVKALGVGDHGIKTDRRDAQHLSEASCRLDLPSVHIPSQQSRDLKMQLGSRSALVKSRTLLINHVRGTLRQQRLRPRSGDPKTFATRVRELGPVMNCLEPLLASIESISDQLSQTEKVVARLAKDSEVCRRLMTVPGVGPITALSFFASLDDIKRFGKSHAVQSYLGLSPGENSSSGRLRRTSITKAGHVYTRYTLVQAAWSAMRTRPDDPMVLWSKEVQKRRGLHVAVVALARKMAGILYSLWKNQTTYDPAKGAMPTAN